MSEVAGRMSVQVGANCLQKANGGFGVLLGGVPGVAPAKVVVLGGGVSGTHAAEMAVGLRADVTVVDRSVKRLRELSSIFGSQLKTVYSTAHAIEELVRDADLVIGAVLIAGAAAPKLVTRAMVKTMKPGAVLVDIAIDQGGCFETSRPTTHAEPTYRARRRDPLLRHQHAGRGAAHLDLRADQCDAALREGARRSRLAASASPRMRGWRTA
jgi:alanine dehydrogenase